MEKLNILLASKSPRRRELLEKLDVAFTLATDFNCEEIIPKNTEPEKVAEYLSELKSKAYPYSIENNMLITADTVVISKGKILGKPKDEKDAYSMLSELSGNTHKVITGVTLKTELTSISFSETTKVSFRELSEEEKEHYIAKYKPYDKAGAYGIQEWIGCIGISKIEGCFYNVMGLPLFSLYKHIAEQVYFQNTNK